MTLAADRLGKAREALQQSEFDWVVMASPETVGYVTGHSSVSADAFRDFRSVALLSSDELYLVGPGLDSGPAVMESLIEAGRYVPFGAFYFESQLEDDPILARAKTHETLEDALADTLTSLMVGTEAVGLDRKAHSLVSRMPGNTVMAFLDAHEWTIQLRATKLPGEIVLLGRAARLAESGIAAAFDHAREGVSERELASIVIQTMAEGGAMPRFSVVASGERSALADARPTERRLQRGDLVRMDVGCVLDGYWSDVARTAVVGEPDELQQARYDAILEGQKAQLHVAAPGVAASDVFDAAIHAVESHGLVPYRRHHCGHAIGTEVYEWPMIAPSESAVLEAGMTFSFETPFYELYWGGMMVEDALTITDNGCERLTITDRSLRAVG